MSQPQPKLIKQTQSTSSKLGMDTRQLPETSYFADRRRIIDFVLVYELDNQNEMSAYRQHYEELLKRLILVLFIHFTLYRTRHKVPSTQRTLVLNYKSALKIYFRIIIFSRGIEMEYEVMTDADGKYTQFVKLHTIFESLCREAEALKYQVKIASLLQNCMTLISV